MRKLGAALIILLGLANAALAQTKFIMPPPGGVTVVGVQVVASCGAASGLAANNVAYLAMDTTGVLCTSVSGGGITAAVTVADGADATLGAKADAICGTATGTCTLVALAKFLNTAATSAIPAGSAIIGKVGIDQTTPGITNLVALTAETTKVIGTVNQGTNPWITSTTLAAGTNRLGYTSDDPCTQKIKLNTAFTTSSGGPVSIIALSGSTVIYICSISAITDTAIKLSFIDGTGGSCASAQHAIWGSTTAANGMSLPDNGGFTQGSGNGSVGVTTAASAFCLLQSGTSLVAGNVSYVQQ